MAPGNSRWIRFLAWSLWAALGAGGCAATPDTGEGLGGTGIVSQAPDEGLGGTGMRPRAPDEGLGGTGIVAQAPGGLGGTGRSGPGDDPDGGIGGTGIIGIGIVQGFGSVFVNGREYFLTDTTPVSIDGRDASEAELALGDTVVVHGRIDPASGRSIAASIESRHDLIGRIESIDAAGGRFTLHGQQLTVDAATFGDTDDGRFDLSTLKAGDPVAVSGHARGNGRWMVTRVQPVADADDRFVITGRVAALDRRSGRVDLGGTVLEIPPASAAALAPGQRVRLAGRREGARLRVDAVIPQRPPALATGQIVEIAGLIEGVAPDGRMLCNDLQLLASPATEWQGGHGTDITPDLPVAVRGVVQADGSIVAERIVLRADFARVRLPAAGRPAVEGAPSANAVDRPGNARPPGAGAKPGIDRPRINRPNIHRPELPPVPGRGASPPNRPPHSYK